MKCYPDDVMGESTRSTRPRTPLPYTTHIPRRVAKKKMAAQKLQEFWKAEKREILALEKVKSTRKSSQTILTC